MSEHKTALVYNNTNYRGEVRRGSWSHGYFTEEVLQYPAWHHTTCVLCNSKRTYKNIILIKFNQLCGKYCWGSISQGRGLAWAMRGQPTENRVGLYFTLVWSRTHYVAEGDLVLLSLQLLSTKLRNCRQEPPRPVTGAFETKVSLGSPSWA